MSHIDFDSTTQNSLENFLKAITNEAIEIVKQEAEQFGTDTNVGSKGNDVLEFANLLKELCCKKDEDYDNPIISPKYLNDTIENLLLDFNEQYNNGWIPCSERLPEEHKLYDITTKNEVGIHSDTAIYNPFVGMWFWDESESKHIEIEVLAWKEKDKPYHPKGE